MMLIAIIMVPISIAFFVIVAGLIVRYFIVKKFKLKEDKQTNRIF